MSHRCAMELWPNWDGDTCPCETFGLEPGVPAPDGTYTIEARTADDPD